MVKINVLKCENLPDCFVRLHEHCPVSAGNWHGVVAYADLVPPQQDLASDLQSLVESSQ